MSEALPSQTSSTPIPPTSSEIPAAPSNKPNFVDKHAKEQFPLPTSFHEAARARKERQQAQMRSDLERAAFDPAAQVRILHRLLFLYSNRHRYTNRLGQKWLIGQINAKRKARTIIWPLLVMVWCRSVKRQDRLQQIPLRLPSPKKQFHSLLSSLKIRLQWITTLISSPIPLGEFNRQHYI